ncbi:MAG: hypothetical protein V1674_01010 [Candidatus Omnitrophota bacterium]
MRLRFQQYIFDGLIGICVEVCLALALMLVAFIVGRLIILIK